jgi:hypothetical protein
VTTFDGVGGVTYRGNSVVNAQGAPSNCRTAVR